MSNSYKHTPIIPVTTCDSEKEFKRECHGARRAFLRENIFRALQIDPEDADVIDFNLKDGGWIGPKDGKMYCNPCTTDPKELRRWMRK